MEDEIDALFKLPLGEFTSARNALAVRFKKPGEKAMADDAKALPKPSVAAWVVNQLYWQHRKPFDRLIDAGDRYRQAQAKQQRHNSAGMRERLEARREAEAALVPIATAVLHEAGYGDTRTMLRRVTSTLEALATYGSLPDAPRAGRLTAEVAPPGFDVLAALLPGSGEPHRATKLASVATRSPAPAPKPADRSDAREAERRRIAAAAKADVRDSERALRAARAQAERTAATLEMATKRAKESERRRAQVEKQFAKVVTEADAAREHARAAEANARKAALEAESAERLLEVARRKWDEL